MIKEFIKKWEKYKRDLENYFKTNKQSEYDSYEKIVKKIIELIINKDSSDKYLYGDLLVIDDGNYQGTQIFIAHINCYEPSIEDYIYTNNYYGTCSGCDTLLGISCYEDGLPNEQQIKEYMNLSLHLIQKFRRFKDE